MSTAPDTATEFASLAAYSLKDRLLIRLADLVFFAVIRTLGATARFEVEGGEHERAIANDGRLPIYTFWHDRILLGTYFFRGRGIVVMTSRSFDGEYIARFIQRLGYGAARGSSSRGGARALIEMIRAMRGGRPAAFPIDGPRGPRYEVKAGPLLLAKQTGNAVLPMIVQPKRFWTVGSWDRMQIPRPFTRARVLFGPPIYIDENATDADMLRHLDELRSSLDDITRRGAEWSSQPD